jgi:hypothetical protein
VGFANAKKTQFVKPTYCSPNSSVNAVTDVGLDEVGIDEASLPTVLKHQHWCGFWSIYGRRCRLNGDLRWPGRLGKQLHRLPNNGINAITDVGQMKRAQPTALGLAKCGTVAALKSHWRSLTQLNPYGQLPQ